MSLFNQQRYIEAEALARLMTENFPLDGFGWKVLGASLQAQGKDALPAMQKAANLSTDDAEAYYNQGIALQGLGRLDEAAESYRQALRIKPDYSEAHSNLGAALQELGRLNDAVASYRLALEFKPNYAEAHYNLGNVLRELGRFDEAGTSYRRALQIKPNYAEAYVNLGNVLRELGQLDAAVANYRQALQIKPYYAGAHSNLLCAHNYLPDQPTGILLAEARCFGDMVARQARPYAKWPNVPEPERCLRVGLVSGNLRTHVIGYFIEGVLAALASSSICQMDLIAYSNHFLNDALTERIKACCHGWHSVVGLSDKDVARQIHDDGIDILIDLSGHTGHNRLPMFAWKPAPVQVSWLGYISTTGVAAIDYIIADPWAVPEGGEVYFSEKIWRLPETYMCFTAPDVDVQVGPLSALFSGYITFGSFNNLTKMNDAVVALWSRVLQSVPNSRLFLKTNQLDAATVRSNTAERFAIHGIDAGRLILEGSSPRTELLASYSRVDIALDPFPYPGGATSIEALWMGVPVIIKHGKGILSHGETIAHNAGLSDWIAVNEDDYIKKAVAYSSDLDRLANIRARLRQQVLASPLFDAPRFAQHFEIALRGMWTQWCVNNKDRLNLAV